MFLPVKDPQKLKQNLMFIFDAASNLNSTRFFMHAPSWRSLDHLNCYKEVLINFLLLHLT